MNQALALAILAATLAVACTDPYEEGEAACVAAGGACVNVADCDVGDGFVAGDVEECANAFSLCCLAECNGETEDFECSDGSATFRPLCEEGDLQCRPGETEQPLQG